MKPIVIKATGGLKCAELDAPLSALLYRGVPGSISSCLETETRGRVRRPAT